jgi:hypothetical protein
MMGLYKKTIAGFLIGFAVASAYAANDSAIVKLEVTHDSYVNLLGTAVGASKSFTVDEIRPSLNDRPAMLLGTLGVESNALGSCTLSFSTQNAFKLKHTISDQLLTNYLIIYKGNKIDEITPTVIFPSCNVSLTKLKFRRRATFNANPEAGTYRDVVSITVTTQ